MQTASASVAFPWEEPFLAQDKGPVEECEGLGVLPPRCLCLPPVCHSVAPRAGWPLAQQLKEHLLGLPNALNN